MQLEKVVEYNEINTGKGQVHTENTGGGKWVRSSKKKKTTSLVFVNPQGCGFGGGGVAS